MVSYTYTKESWPSFYDGIKKEWVITNGLGSYGGSSLIGAHNRTHQGYFIASLHSPTDRYLILSKINETIYINDQKIDLETSQHLINGKTEYKNGQNHLSQFIYDGTVKYVYSHSLFSLTKEIALSYGENKCAIFYEVCNNSNAAAKLELLPLFNYRNHNDSSTINTLNFKTMLQNRSLLLYPVDNNDLFICFQISEGSFKPSSSNYDINMQMQTELDLETPGLDCHYTPYNVCLTIPPLSKTKISIICSIFDVSSTPFQIPTDISSTSALQIIKKVRCYYNSLIKQASLHDFFADELVLASDHFLCHRTSTGMKTILAGLPWFTDWGRDTMIAFTGLTLCTKRYDAAKEILITFSKYIKNGIVPNMFPDNNTAPLYNTVDASLWYFIAVERYLHYVNTNNAYQFIQEEIYPHLKEIITAYQIGTDFHIYMEDDGLIHAGSDLDQITWMDVRVGNWVVTPRHGKPVEINALWYNALRIMESLGEKFGEVSDEYICLADKVKDSFQKKFWDVSNNCLYDVIDGEFPDNHLRPNQIYAVSLPYPILEKWQEECIVKIVYEKLYIGCALRSLSCDHPDYHGIYSGALKKRDAAYHQGTGWGFLLGAFLSAYLKINNHSKKSIDEALSLLVPVKKHLTDEACIGSISEIFDGSSPHAPRGCYAQAWSVGEILRAYCEDILPYLSN